MPNETDELEPQQPPRGPARYKWWGAIGGTIGLALAIFVIKPMLKPSATPGLDSPASSIWTITTSKDAMTDATRSVASAVFRGEHYKIELHITCGSDGLLRYEANTFDPENKPAPLRAELTDGAVPFVPFQVRVDQEPASDQRSFEPAFNNQIFVQNRAQIVGNQLGLTYNDVDLPGRMAQGRKIALRLPVAGGDETISFEQTDPALRKMLAPCLPTPTPAASAPGMAVDPSPSAVEPSNAEYYDEAKRSAEQAYRHLPPRIVAVLGQEAGADELCRGSSDEATIAKWCPIRDRLVKELEGMGMCFGRPTDQSAAESDWHLCDQRDRKAPSTPDR